MSGDPFFSRIDSLAVCARAVSCGLLQRCRENSRRGRSKRTRRRLSTSLGVKGKRLLRVTSTGAADPVRMAHGRHERRQEMACPSRDRIDVGNSGRGRKQPEPQERPQLVGNHSLSMRFETVGDRAQSQHRSPIENCARAAVTSEPLPISPFAQQQ